MHLHQHQPEITYLKNYTKPAFSVESLNLRFDLGEEHTLVTAKSVMHRNKDAQDADLVLDGHQLKLISVVLNGEKLTEKNYQRSDETLRISNVPDKFILEIVTEIKPQENTALCGLYKANNIYCTQCEAEGFRRITYFFDRPDVLTSFTTTITADKKRYPVLLSNGNLIAEENLADGRHLVTWEDPFKKPCYLFALVAGDLDCLEDHFVTKSGRKVTLQIFVDKGNLDKSQHGMDCIKKAMAWDEQAYGREYDLDIFMVVAINDFNMGAMENKGLNIFNAKYILANSKVATDLDYQNVLRVVGHEYFHNWSGNRVTCRDWFQLSLKEGLTIFREQGFMEDMTSEAVARIEEVRYLRGRQFIEDAGPFAHSVRPESYVAIDNFYTATIYNKGSEVIRMQRTLLGKEKFRQAMDLYFARFDGQAVTIEDFVKCMEEVSGRDFTQLRRWYSQAGTPTLTIQYHYDIAQHKFTMTVEQYCSATPGQPEKLPFHMPLAMGLLDSKGKNMPLQLSNQNKPIDGDTFVLEIREPKHIFEFVNVKEQPVPAFLRGFSAPVKLKVNYSDKELLFLLQYETDGYARWDAGQQLACRIMLQMIKDHQAKKPLAFDKQYGDALKQVLHDQQIDDAFKAELLILPSENYISEMLEEIDVDAVHHVHDFVSKELAQYLKDELYKIYHQQNQVTEYKVDTASMAARRLKNICLGYLMQLPDEKSQTECLKQFKDANNMTDKLSALAGIVNKIWPEREKAINEFYEEWKHDSLVMDKWLSLQATSEVPGVLSQVKSLVQHPAFNIKNPNKVYALIGGFTVNNLAYFHDASGAGYEFLADQVITLDNLNPQVAARMIEPLTRWKRYDKIRQNLMRKQLERILQIKGLSKNVYELVTKSLV